ncbi:MAG: hypothetical protein WD052_12740 [Bacteroidales bacterium]
MRSYLATITLLVITGFAILQGQVGPYSSLENNVLTLDNGLIKRVIVLDNGDGQIATTRLSLTADDFNFISTGNITREFSIQVFNLSLSGVKRWESSGWYQ